MNQIAADGVSPVHVAPGPAVRIVLEKEVVFAFEENHAVQLTAESSAVPLIDYEAAQQQQ